MNQKKKEDLRFKYDVEISLECLWAIRDRDKFYFMEYGKMLIDNLIKQEKKKQK